MIGLILNHLDVIDVELSDIKNSADAVKNKQKHTVMSVRVSGDTMENTIRYELEAMSLAELKQFESDFKAYAKARKAELKAEISAKNKELVTEGAEVIVRAPATWGVETVTGIVTGVRDKSFTITVDRGDEKPKKLVRTYDAFIGLTSEMASYEATPSVESEHTEAVS